MDINPDTGVNHHFTEPTPRGLYCMGLYDGLFRFDGQLEHERDFINAPDELIECMNHALNGEWEHPLWSSADEGED